VRKVLWRNPEQGDLRQDACFLEKNPKWSDVEKGAREALIEAALWMERHGELEEAAFILRRTAFGCGYRQFSGSATIGNALPTDASPVLAQAVLRNSELPGMFGTQENWNVRPAMKVVVPRLRHPDNLERAVAVAAAEDILSSASFNASPRFPELAEMTGPLLRRLVSDENAFIQERALAGLEIIGARLFYSVREHWQLLLPAVESLLAAGVHLEWQLERRFACRLWSGDDEGARQDMQARLELEQTPPRPELSAFFEREIEARGRSVPFLSLQQPAISVPSAPPPNEVDTASHGHRSVMPAAKPRGKRRPIDRIDPMEFVALMVTSVRDDFVRSALAGPRASERCLKLTISISGVPRGGPLSRFTGPGYSLTRVADASHALDIYRRLNQVYVAKKRPKALADLVAKIAEEQAEDTRFIWFWVREIFDDATGGERERFENAIVREAEGADLSDLWLPFGNQCYRAQGDRAEKLATLFEQAFASGMGPALAHTVLEELPQRLHAEEVLQPLPRASEFKTELRFRTPPDDLRRTEFSVG
jgi:hypothetical protein